MRTSNIIAFLARGKWLGLGALALVLALPAADAVAGISNTRHNLTSTGPGNSFTPSGGTEEICVFCHTPHGGSSTAPLWNRAVPAGPYTVYASTTMDQTAGQPGGISLACLSCHDGTQAMDSIINHPGSGGYQGTVGGRMAGTWTAGTPATVNTTTGVMLNAGDRISMLSQDLSNDHPIGIRYCASTGALTSGAITNCGDQDFKAPTRDATNGYWWVATSGGGSTRRRVDMVLYGTGTQPTVECGSCHDPHVETGQATGVAGVTSGATFLRISNAGSAVCLACHVK